ncbi:NADAR family protein, partial [Glaciecola siphonariae]
MEDVIYFYTVTDKYGELSNFAKLGFEADGKYWPTVEHYFQAKKFEGQTYENKIRRALTAKNARNMGRSREYPIRNDWEVVKVNVMRDALNRKFQNNQAAKILLLSIGGKVLV